MTTAKRLKRFYKQNAPFYIVDHENGQYSLCLPLSFLPDEYRNFGQDAFNQYAEEIGDPVMENRMYTHGSGYEWESVFKKAFESDENIHRIHFDCEAGGFFCDADDLSLLEDFGSRFRAICEDRDGFAQLVSYALKEAEIQRAEEEKLNSTVRGFLMNNPGVRVEMMTPHGLLSLTAEQGQKLLDGSMEMISVAGVNVTADEILNQQITHIQQNLLDFNLFQMITEDGDEYEEETEDIAMSM